MADNKTEQMSELKPGQMLTPMSLHTQSTGQVGTECDNKSENMSEPCIQNNLAQETKITMR